MDNEFYTLLTDKGMAKIASALADKKQIYLQKMAVGDGGGQYYEPTTSQTTLRHEVWRGDMNTLTVAPNNPNWLIAELVLPEEIGGWYVREVGVFDADGELIAIGKFPESYKPLLPGGCGKQVCIRLIMEVSNTTAVTLTVDPSIVLATRDYVDSLLDEHEHSTNHPDATLTQKGFTQLSNSTDSDDETKAATPKAVKAAMVEARNHTHTWSQITDIPDSTLTQKGIVKLNDATDSISTTEAATPSAVKAAMDKANAAAPAGHTHAWDQISDVPDGTLIQKGIVKLNNATDSTSTTEAATPNAVKAAMDKANAAISTSDGDTRYLGNFAFFTEDGTFTVPPGVTSVFVEMIGGGGGGMGNYFLNKGSNSWEKYRPGGLASSPVISMVTVIPGEKIKVTVGNGGAGGIEDNSINGSGAYGGAGGDSSFGNLKAPGGHGPFLSGIQVPIPSDSDLTYSKVPGGDGENSPYGNGGKGICLEMNLNTSVASTNASGYGAGGSGVASIGGTSAIYPAGNGSPGFVKIIW